MTVTNTDPLTASQTTTDTTATVELSVLDLIVARIQLRGHRRTAWLQHLNAHQQDSNPTSFDHNIYKRDIPELEAQWYAQTASLENCNLELEQIETQLAGIAGEKLTQLDSLFNLSQIENELLQTTLALAVSPALGQMYAYLQQAPGRNYTTENLVAQLFGYGQRPLWNASATLAVWGLVRTGDASPAEPTPLIADSILCDWLLNTPTIDPELLGIVRQLQPKQPLENWPIEQTLRDIQRALDQDLGVRVIISAAHGSGRRTFAAIIAEQLGIPALSVDSDRIPDSEWPVNFIRAQRLAILLRTALVWHGENFDRPWSNDIAAAPLQFITCETVAQIPIQPELIDIYVALSAPTSAERYQLCVQQLPISKTWPQHQLKDLTSRHQLTVAEIDILARRNPSSLEQASTICRQLTRHRLGDLGQILECPFSWNDLIVPENLQLALKDFAFEACERTVFWEQTSARRLFPRGRGLVGLFSGPPGTGKTMAAQVIAAKLGLDLIRIDLATVVSKYIGETSKNLKQIFQRAQQMDAILLFDEADSLFGKRTNVKDAHDRHANSDTNYLLQLLEEYQGIALLASNKRGNIDPAFTRRMRYVFDFPKPDAQLSYQIWKHVISELYDHDTVTRLQKNLKNFSDQIQLSGAQIKNAVLSAIFIARRDRTPLNTEHLLLGVDREIGKEGRSVSKVIREKFFDDRPIQDLTRKGVDSHA